VALLKFNRLLSKEDIMRRAIQSGQLSEIVDSSFKTRQTLQSKLRINRGQLIRSATRAFCGYSCGHFILPPYLV